MAIIIPSKDIYEINNQKVVDNEVDNIEITAKNVVQDNHYSETVYNENVEEGFYPDSKNVISTNHDLLALVIPQIDQRMPFYACSVCANAQYYLDKTIYIPFIIDNTHILNGILTGLDKNDNPNISYSCNGRIINGRTNTGISVIVQADGYRVVGNGTSIFSPPLIEDDYIIETEEDGTYTIPNEETNNYSDSNYTVETKITIERKDNLSTVKAEKVIIDRKEYLKVDLTGILCGIRIIKASGEGTALPTPNYESSTGTGILSGTVYNITYVQYIPKQVSITIYGNTIGIDLKDESVKIGEGQHVYSFSGNELMQTSNKETTDYPISVGDFVRADGEGFSVYSIVQSPTLNIGDILIYNQEKAECVSSNPKQIRVVNGGEWAKMSNVHVSFISHKEVGSQIENYYNNIIRQWRNGKEVATIKCGMVDYFIREEFFTSIYVSGVRNEGSNKCSIVASSENAFPSKENFFSAFITINGKQYELHNLSLYNSNKSISAEIDLSYRDVSSGQNYDVTYYYKSLSISPKDKSLPMTFHIGDTVIPYIKGADGQDKPISYYMDRTTPKEFLVIGKGITADGEILQELTLQEIPQV